jgi:hypothetical protein
MNNRLVVVMVMDQSEQGLLVRDVAKGRVDGESLLDVCLGCGEILVVEVELGELEVELGGEGTDAVRGEEEGAVVLPVGVARDGSVDEEEEVWCGEEKREEGEGEMSTGRGAGGEGEKGEDGRKEGEQQRRAAVDEDAEEVAIA